MSCCPKCARLGLRRRVKRNNRIKINGIWHHKKCPNLTPKEMERAKRVFFEDEKFVFGDPKAEINYKIVSITDSKVPIRRNNGQDRTIF